ncbi:MAG: nucleotidyltransferase family protein [Alphaproteobacteria bacterium]|nr:nucleotidyltransferase family protein [Alphaproteobacteria bacterium]
MTVEMPKTAMVLAAGLGSRMGGLTETRPKPLLQVGGRAIIDRVLDRLAAAGVGRVVVNLHHHADLLRQHLSNRSEPAIEFSDESDRLMNTGGGVAKALPLLGAEPFFVINGDVIWFDGMGNSLHDLALRFQPDSMSALLLMQPTVGAVGYGGIGDFGMRPDGRLFRRPEREVVPFIHAGVQILAPALFTDCPRGPFSLNLVYDRAAEQKRLFGLRHEGQWMELNRPEGLIAAEQALLE